MSDVIVTYHPVDVGDVVGLTVVSSPRGHTTLRDFREQWQAENLAHMLGAEFRVFGT